MKIAFALIFLFFLSCGNQHIKAPDSQNESSSVQLKNEDSSEKPALLDSPKVENQTSNDSVRQTDFFSDSLTVGRSGFNKIEISKYSLSDSGFAMVKFYSKIGNKWVLRNNFGVTKNDINGLDTKLSDFNNDGLNDVTFISVQAARGANEVRRLLIYDKKNDSLINITNSESYPNMLYNKDLNCIDAFLVYGGCSTVFLKISGDSLREFASVEAMDGITVSEYDNHGNERVIFRDSKNKAAYIRFKNYKPLKPYDEF